MEHLITIAVAAYNVERYIDKMIDSIIGQTYSNLEILIVNDGSTDSTLQICESYNDPRIRIITKPNGGLSTARQTALDEAKGEYICMVDGDDILHPDYAEKLYRAIRQSNADICVCEYREFTDSPDEGGRIVPLLGEKSGKITTSQLESEFLRLILAYHLADSWNKMYRVAFLRSTNVKFCLEKQYNGTDLLFNHLLTFHQPAYAVLHEPLFFYRLTPNSRVRRKDKDLQTGFQIIIERLLEEIQTLSYSEKVTQQIYWAHLGMARRALADRHKHADSYKEFKSKYKIFKPQFFAFHKKHFDGFSPFSCSKGIIIFYLLLRLPGSFLMYTYLTLRQRRIKKLTQ